MIGIFGKNENRIGRLNSNLSFKIPNKSDNFFYLTGGTALSRGYLNHRYSDDLDFFVNNADNFREQVETVIKTLSKKNIEIQVAVADVSFVRVSINS